MSGRLSASDGLQTIPSNSVFGKPIKSCFVPPEGWLFCYSDFASLEDRINSLLTKDENKLKVYTDGYDGHALRAYAYFKKEMPDVYQANETERAFKVVVDNQIYWCKSGDFVTISSGERMTIEEYYDTHSKL